MKKNKKKELITNAWKTLVSALEDMDHDHEIVIGLYSELLKGLPGVVIVEEEWRRKGSYIEGSIQLYTDNEHNLLSGRRQRNLTLAFVFKVHNRATVSKGWFNGPKLFSGSWLGALEFIINKIYKSDLRQSLSEDQSHAFEELIKKLKK